LPSTVPQIVFITL